jgi:hypothetical protein
MADSSKTITRRSLIQLSGGAAAFVGAARAGECLKLWQKVQLQDLTAESFRRYEGQNLVFSRPAAAGAILTRTVTLKLAKVSTHERVAQIEVRNPEKYAKRDRESFSLLFELAGGEPLGNGLHRLLHPDFAGHQLFLAQISRPRTDGTRLYEAVFG